MSDKIPVYYINADALLDRSSKEYKEGILFSYVQRPAIQKKAMAFSNLKKFEFDELQGILAGPALVPDEKIYRVDDDGEYYVVFKEDEVKKIAYAFLNQERLNRFNDDHQPKMVDSGVMGGWIIESKGDKSESKYGFKDLKLGTFFIESKFNDMEYFRNEILLNEKNGYSLEAWLGLDMFLSDVRKKHKIDMSKKQKLEGVNAYIELPVGTYTIGDKVYTVIEYIENEGTENEYRCNKIESIVPISEAGGKETALKMNQTMKKNWRKITDLAKFNITKLGTFSEIEIEGGKVLSIDGDLVLGASANLAKEDGSMDVAPDETYKSADGKLEIVIENGKIKSLTSIEAMEEDKSKDKPEDKPADKPADKPEDNKMAEDVPVDAPADTAKIDELNKKIEELYAKIGDLEAKISGMMPEDKTQMNKFTIADRIRAIQKK